MRGKWMIFAVCNVPQTTQLSSIHLLNLSLHPYQRISQHLIANNLM